ncbi:hypothetical protein ACLKA6_017839 [Drosophila palustris]
MQLNQLTPLANKKQQHLHLKCSESKYWQQQQQQLQRVVDQQHLSTVGKRQGTIAPIMEQDPNQRIQ